jgi:hypothetical protein
MSPAELADEYGCTNGHVRNTLADLREQDRVKRVQRGKYVDSESAPDVPDVDIEAEMPPNTEDGAESETRDGDVQGEADPSADGGPLSVDTDTPVEADREDGDSMPTDEEYQQQREAYRDGSEADESDGEDEAADEAESDGESGEVVVETVEEAEVDLPLPVDPRTLMMVVAAAALAWLAYQAVQSSPEPASEGSEQEPDAAQEPDEVPGGLV